MKNGLSKKVGTAVTSIIFVISLSIINTYASHQELDLFDRGYEFYLSYQPEKAVETLRIFLNEFPNSSAKDAALFWLGRSLVKLSSFEEAKKVFDELKQQIPDSPFMVYVDKELEMMNAAGTEHKTMTGITKADSEIQVLKKDIVQSERTLLEVTEERDKLRLQLEEEKKKNEELKATAVRFDIELKYLFEKLKALRKNWEDDQSSLTISQDENGNLASGVQLTRNEEVRGEIGERAAKDEVQCIEKKQENQMNPPPDANPDVQKEQFVTKQEILHTLELIAHEETWIFVTIDEKESKERLLKPGSHTKWTARSGFSLKIGNAGGIKLLFDGKEIGPLGEKGKVVRLRLPSVKISSSNREASGLN
jgi:RodZ C-terminal domain/Tetratricopeptide repeat